MKAPRIMLTAPCSGSGKTTIVCGLLQALKNRGTNVISFKCGPDYIDPMFHQKVIGMPSRNLDTFFAGEDVVRYLFARQAKTAELSVMEGVMGYYDGVAGITTQASSYDLARVTDTPVILIINARGMSLSVVPFIKGFLEYKQDSNIKGVILNQISPMMYPDLKRMIEAELPIHVYGYVPKLENCVIESRHLGLVTPDEIKDLQNQLLSLAETMEQSLELEEILALAQTASEVTDEIPAQLAGLPMTAEKVTRIGVARDEGFCFYYEDNLQLLRDLGAELVPFSPIHDSRLPEDISGLLIGGGYPELYAKQLSENVSMREDIKTAIHGGLPYLAECGGFMYLHEEMENLEKTPFSMVGIVPGRVHYTGKLGRFGYIELTANVDSVLGKAGMKVKAHEFHYFDSSNNGTDFHAGKPHRKRSWECIHGTGDSISGFPHLYYYSNPETAVNFVEACCRFGKEKEQDLC